jgi:hypothetical protein
MKDWLEEIVDQIAVGELLGKSTVSCGQRFGLIAIDNAVEFMLIAYVEIYKQLVGSHKGVISNKDWEETKKAFPKILGFVAAQEPKIQPLESEINRFHEFRNKLYHSGSPTTTSSPRVLQYKQLAVQVLDNLFSIVFTTEEWEQRLSRISAQFSGSAFREVKHTVSYEMVNGIVKFTTAETLTASESVALCLHGYSVLTGDQPSRPQLIRSLALSGYPLDSKVLNARLYDMRRDGWIGKSDLGLKSKGQRQIRKKYLI